MHVSRLLSETASPTLTDEYALMGGDPATLDFVFVLVPMLLAALLPALSVFRFYMCSAMQLCCPQKKQFKSVRGNAAMRRALAAVKVSVILNQSTDAAYNARVARQGHF